LGADLFVTTLDGKKIKVKIPLGIQNGKMLRIREEGIPTGARRGDLYIKLIIQIPTKLSKRGKELLEELSKSEGEIDTPKPIPLSELRKD
jgi:molecular chaperone DnaJ